MCKDQLIKMQFNKIWYRRKKMVYILKKECLLLLTEVLIASGCPDSSCDTLSSLYGKDRIYIVK